MVPRLEVQQRAGRMTKDDVDSLSELRAAISGDARGSALYRWMWDHYAAFSELVDVPRPNWKGVTAYFAGQGFVSATGKPLTPNSVKKTWERVERRRQAQEASRRKREQPLSVSVSAVREDDRQVVERRRTALAGTEPVGEVDRSGATEESVRKLKEQLGRRGAMPAPLRRE